MDIPCTSKPCSAKIIRMDISKSPNSSKKHSSLLSSEYEKSWKNYFNNYRNVKKKIDLEHYYETIHFVNREPNLFLQIEFSHLKRKMI